MNNEKIIKDILEDLYQLDPELKKKEKELLRLVEALLAAKPRVDFDEKSSAELKAELLKRFEEIESKNMKKNLFPAFSWPSFSYGLSAMAVVILVALSFAASPLLGGKTNRVALKENPTFKNRIVKLSQNAAFGSLASAQNANNQNRQALRQEAGNVQAPVSPSNAPAPEADASRSASYGLGGGAANAKMMVDGAIMPPYQGYKYVYAGAEFDQPESLVTVYKKASSPMDLGSLFGSLKNMNLGLLDVSKLRDVKVDTVGFKEDREFGYYLGISPVVNNYYLAKNWERWPNPYARCQDDKCWQDNRIKMSDLPSDEEALKIAADFLSEYGISLEGYGQPFVQNNWRASYESYPDKANYYFPEEVSIIYPLLVEGQEVYGSDGNKQGAMLSIDVRNRKVSNFNAALAPSFESSAYDAMTDKAEILKRAEAGGMNNWYYYGAPAEGSAEAATIELDTPQKVLLSYWKYDQERSTSEEIYVPALIFPIKSKPSDIYFYQSNVVVPLVKEIADQYNPPILMKGVPEPAAAMEGSVSSETKAEPEKIE